MAAIAEQGSSRPTVASDLLTALPAWAVARLVVGFALAVSHFIADKLATPDGGVRAQLHQGLFAWDAGFYRGIAAHGYGFGAVHNEALRFFPLVPVSARVLGVVLGGRSDIALILVANVSALVMGALVHRLVWTETDDGALARRAVWLMAIFPASTVLVLGYAEATFMALAVAMFLAIRTNHWWVAIALGVLAGLTRPVGVLLAIPAAVEAIRWVADPGSAVLPGTSRWRGALVRMMGVIAGPAGAAIFFAWSWARYGDPLLPLHVQQDGRLRGQFVDPITALLHESRGIVHGQHIGSGLHVPWAIALAVLVVVCLRRWPVSYGLFAGAMLLAACSSRNLDSLERYGLSAFPFVLTVADLCTNEYLERATLIVSATMMQAYAILAFLNASVP